jgi:hypothetical protein
MLADLSADVGRELKKQKRRDVTFALVRDAIAKNDNFKFLKGSLLLLI